MAMPRVVKYVMVSLGVLVSILVVCVGAVYAATSSRLRARVPLPTHEFAAPNDSASIARGERLVRSLGKCAECHGQDLGGATLNDDLIIGTLGGPNITSGRGGLPAKFTDIAYERAIRHGLAMDGRRLVLMPSEDFQHLSDADVGALVAYLRTVPPVDRERIPLRLGPLARALHLAGQFPLFPHDIITHREDVVAAVPEDTTVAYGKYIGDIGCAGCHGLTYGGGKIPGAPPQFPATANLTPTGIGHYTFEGFAQTLRTGTRPDGSALDPFMPIQATKLMTEVEMRAVWIYLRTLAPREFGTR